jgi:hypothetical protein
MKGVLEEVGEVSRRLNSSHSEHTDTLRPCTHAHNLPLESFVFYSAKMGIWRNI